MRTELALIAGVDEQRDLPVDVGERAGDRLDVGEIALPDVVGEPLEHFRQRFDGENARAPPAQSRGVERIAPDAGADVEKHEVALQALRQQRPLRRVEILRREQEALFRDVAVGIEAHARAQRIDVDRPAAQRARRDAAQEEGGPLAEPPERAAARHAQGEGADAARREMAEGRGFDEPVTGHARSPLT